MKLVEIKCDICRKSISTEERNNENENINKTTMGNETIIMECCKDCATKIKAYIQDLKNEGLDKEEYNFERK